MKSGSCSPQLEKAPQSSEDPAQPKINFKKEKKKKTSQKDQKKKKKAKKMFALTHISWLVLPTSDI